MAEKRPIDALFRWASDNHRAMHAVMGLLAEVPLLEEDQAPEIYIEMTHAWHASVIESISRARSLMASPPPGDHDPTVMRSLRAGQAGTRGILDYGTELARLVLKILESMASGSEPKVDTLLDLMLEYPVLILESRTQQLVDSAAALQPEDAVGRLMAVNGLAHLLVVEIQRADVAAERKQYVDLAALGDKLDGYVRDYDSAIPIAERQMKILEQSIPEQPEADRHLLSQLIPGYFEDIAQFRLLHEPLSGLPKMARSSRTAAAFVKKSRPVWKAFRRMEDANEQRTMHRSELMRQR